MFVFHPSFIIIIFWMNFIKLSLKIFSWQHLMSIVRNLPLLLSYDLEYLLLKYFAFIRSRQSLYMCILHKCTHTFNLCTSVYILNYTYIWLYTYAYTSSNTCAGAEMHEHAINPPQKYIYNLCIHLYIHIHGYPHIIIYTHTRYTREYTHTYIHKHANLHLCRPRSLLMNYT